MFMVHHGYILSLEREKIIWKKYGKSLESCVQKYLYEPCENLNCCNKFKKMQKNTGTRLFDLSQMIMRFDDWIKSF